MAEGEKKFWVPSAASAPSVVAVTAVLAGGGLSTWTARRTVCSNTAGSGLGQQVGQDVVGHRRDAGGHVAELVAEPDRLVAGAGDPRRRARRAGGEHRAGDVEDEVDLGVGSHRRPCSSSGATGWAAARPSRQRDPGDPQHDGQPAAGRRRRQPEHAPGASAPGGRRARAPRAARRRRAPRAPRAGSGRRARRASVPPPGNSAARAAVALRRAGRRVVGAASGALRDELAQQQLEVELRVLVRRVEPDRGLEVGRRSGRPAPARSARTAASRRRRGCRAGSRPPSARRWSPLRASSVELRLELAPVARLGQPVVVAAARGLHGRELLCRAPGSAARRRARAALAPDRTAAASRRARPRSAGSDANCAVSVPHGVPPAEHVRGEERQHDGRHEQHDRRREPRTRISRRLM